MDPDPYRAITLEYHCIHPVSRRRLETHLGRNLDGCVEAIRNDRPKPATSDTLLRTVLASPGPAATAQLVALHALAPKLRFRIAASASAEYHADALGNLALVLLDSDLSGSGIAHRIINRAHNRTWRAARRVRTSGGHQPFTTSPYDPDRLVHLHECSDPGTDDIAAHVADHVDLARFATAIEKAVNAGQVPSTTWTTYRDHRLRRAINPGGKPTSGAQRVAAHRAAHRLAPYIETHLDGHAA